MLAFGGNRKMNMFYCSAHFHSVGIVLKGNIYS